MYGSCLLSLVTGRGTGQVAPAYWCLLGTLLTALSLHSRVSVRLIVLSSTFLST